MAELAILDGPLLEQAQNQTFDLWNEGLTRRAYDQFYSAQVKTAWGRSRLARYGLVDGADLVASAKRYAFDATLDGQAIRVAGLGAVFTNPARRHRGAARELIERILEREAADGADLALLFSEIGPDYYARLGFHPLATHDLALRVIEDTRRGAPMTLVRAGDERDVADIVEMNRIRAEPYRFHLNRDRDLVQYGLTKKRLRAGLDRLGAREVQFFISEEGASAVAYVVIVVRGGAWFVEESGDRDPAGARLGAILQVLVARDPGGPRAPITTWLPAALRPPQLEVTAETPSRDVMMVRPLTPAATAATTLGADEIYYCRGDLF
jgi:GNAT superfamily N-acetyltransferase